MSIIIFLLIVCFLIILHECGHFLVARTHGVRVEKFSIGFGPEVFKRRIKDTEFIGGLVPLGGYVKLAGDDPRDYKGEDYEYLSKPPGIRARIVFAGPLFNYLLSFAFFFLLFSTGFPEMLPSIGKVLKGYPAYDAGIKEGDYVLKIDGKSISNWRSLQGAILKNQGKPLRIKIKRDSKVLDIEVKPKFATMPNILGRKKGLYMIGIAPRGEVVYKRYPLGRALKEGFKKLIFFTSITYQALFYMLTGGLSFREAMTGPLGIYYIAKQAMSIGSSAVIHLVAILNLSLAIFNLLPFPVLDGGHLMFLGLEKIRKRPLSFKVEEWITKFSMGILILLMIFVSLNDVSRFILKR